MGYCTFYGNKYGDVERIYSPVGKNGNLCGVSKGFEDTKKLYITDFSFTSINKIFESGICVKKCPMKADSKLECAKESDSPLCKENKDGKIYNTRGVLNYCFPRSTDDLPASFKAGWKMALNSFKDSKGGAYFNDLYLSSRAIYASIGMSVIYSFVFIFVMSAFAEIIAWIIIVLVQIGLIGGAVGCYFLRADSLDKMYK